MRNTLTSSGDKTMRRLCAAQNAWPAMFVI
jgi:hypothetical protein